MTCVQHVGRNRFSVGEILLHPAPERFAAEFLTRLCSARRRQTPYAATPASRTCVAIFRPQMDRPGPAIDRPPGIRQVIALRRPLMPVASGEIFALARPQRRHSAITPHSPTPSFLHSLAPSFPPSRRNHRVTTEPFHHRAEPPKLRHRLAHPRVVVVPGHIDEEVVIPGPLLGGA